jgi:hypothetical protein
MRTLVAEMKDSKQGIDVQDRVYYTTPTHFTKYQNAFIASDAVNWLVQRLQLDERTPAVDILNDLEQAGIIKHVMGTMKFEDGPQFYRFND